MMEQEIHRRLSILSSLEGAVVKLRYGLGYAETYSFDKIGELLGLTPERVSEIEKQAIEKTRTFKPGA